MSKRGVVGLIVIAAAMAISAGMYGYGSTARAGMSRTDTVCHTRASLSTFNSHFTATQLNVGTSDHVTHYQVVGGIPGTYLVPVWYSLHLSSDWDGKTNGVALSNQQADGDYYFDWAFAPGNTNGDAQSNTFGGLQFTTHGTTSVLGKGLFISRNSTDDSVVGSMDVSAGYLRVKPCSS